MILPESDKYNIKACWRIEIYINRPIIYPHMLYACTYFAYNFRLVEKKKESMAPAIDAHGQWEKGFSGPYEIDAAARFIN